MKESKWLGIRYRALSLLFLIGALGNDSSAAPGDVDLSFDPGSGVNGPVNAVAVQPDGKVIIGGSFTTVKGLQRFKVARLNADGSGDSSFDPGTSIAELNNVDWYISSVVLQSDGKVLIGGNFIVGSFYGIARLNANGTLDSSFDSSEVNATLTSMALQPDGKVLIGGAVLVKDPNNFGTNLHGIVRLNANGSVDSSFNSGSGANAIVRSIALQTDLKILIGGDAGIARLNANGSLDGSFNSGIQATNYYSPSAVFSIAVQPDGKVVVGGFFRSDTNNRTNIARLNANGSLDGSFDPGTSANSDVYSVVVQSDGKVLIGGYFTTFNGTNRNRIARLNADGGLDGSFDPNSGIEIPFSSLVMQPDGKVLIVGDFTTVNGVVRPHIARLYGDPTLPSLGITRSNGFAVLSWPAAFGNFQLQENTNVALPNGWFAVVASRSTNNGFISVTSPATNTHNFFRLRSP